MLTSPQLWEKISAFDIDGGPARLTFAKRLARENGWTQEYTDRVMVEYRRFLYLGCVCGHKVSPSEAVDQAWHLHLTYTDSYWTRLCGETLGRPFHHGPSRGGKEQAQLFDGLYDKTFESYEREFGSPPPADIWSDKEQRFGHDLNWVRVNKEENFIIPRQKVWRVTGIGAASILLISLAGCMPLLAQTDDGIKIVIFSVLGFGLLSVLVYLFVASRRNNGSGGSGCSSSGCSTVSGCSSMGHGHGYGHGHGDGDGDGSGDGGDGGGDGGGGDGGGGCGGGCGGGD